MLQYKVSVTQLQITTNRRNRITIVNVFKWQSNELEHSLI